MEREHATSLLKINKNYIFSCTHGSSFNLKRTCFHRFLSSSNVHGRRVSRKAHRNITIASYKKVSVEAAPPEKKWSWLLLTDNLYSPFLCQKSSTPALFTCYKLHYMQIGRNSCLKLSRKLFASARAHVTLQLPQEMKFNGFDPSSESFLFVQSLLCSIFKFS